jgi:hypothetical protein
MRSMRGGFIFRSRVHSHQVEHLTGLFFEQSRARIGAAEAEGPGMALRATGSAVLVDGGWQSAPAARCFHTSRSRSRSRHGDQTLSAG